MPARQGLKALLVGIALGAIAMGTAVAQSTPVSSVGEDPASAESSSADNITAQGAVASNATPTAGNEVPDTGIRRVGTPFPLGMDPGGYRLGAVHLTNISTSGFYSIATPQGQNTQTLLGTSVNANFVYTHPVTNGMIAVQANPTLSVSGGSAYVNTMGGIDFSKQLTARWSVTASAQWTFYQNEYLLQTPQYLLAYANGGVVLQNVYAQRNGTTTYESNAFAMNYQLSGRTQLSLSPTINTSFSDVDGVSYLVTQLGGGGTLTRSFTANRSGFVYGNATHAFSTQPQSSGSNGWNTYSIGGGLNQKIGLTWYLSGSVGATRQTGLDSHWLPTGSATILRTFQNGSISAAYSRTTAVATLVSSGYFDQVDLVYARQWGRKFGTSLGVSAFRSIETTSKNRGRRANASLSYAWRRNLAWSFSYAYSDQNSTQATLYSGRTNYISVGLNWALGQPGTR